MIRFRDNIEQMSGYVPGEQPKISGLIKLNTNENPYPPSPECLKAMHHFDPDKLRRYPDPTAAEVVRTIAETFNVSDNMVLVGNGSDDILNIAMRCFSDERLAAGSLDPSYSLYPVLAQMQNSKYVKIPLNDDFSVPEDLAEQTLKQKVNIFFLARPNAPTGKAISLAATRKFCREFPGVVLIDEAYADFSENNCLELVKEFANVIVSRTFSKSYSLAGLRFGFALANEKIISGMMKVRDSYNIGALTQQLAVAALKDQKYLQQNCRKIINERKLLAAKLSKLGFSVVDSQANFLFVSPPDKEAKKYFEYLRENAILTRYFPAEATRHHVRISIGTPEQMQRLMEVTATLYQ